MKKTKKAILGSAMAIAMCASLAVGTTYALFTSESEVNIAVTSANVSVKASVTDIVTKTMNVTQGTTEVDGKTQYMWELGGFASETSDGLKLNDIAPGDEISFKINIENESSISIKYRTAIRVKDDTGLFDGLTVTFDDGKTPVVATADATYTPWAVMDGKGALGSVNVSIVFPYSEDDQNAYKDKSCTIVYSVEAVQGNAEVLNPEWNGSSVDSAWFDEAATSYSLSTESQMAGLAELVNAGTSFADKTVTLAADLNLGSKWTAIGTNANKFDGTFDGNGHKINIQKNADDEIIGVFRSTQNATLKNIVLTGSVTGKNVGALVWSLDGGTVDNVVSHVACTSKYTIGMIGTASGECVIKNCVNYGAITSEIAGGGILGEWSGNSSGYSLTMTNCENHARITGKKAGGIIGNSVGNGATDFTVTDCRNFGRIEGTQYGGGVFGYVYNLRNAEVSDCVNTAAVSTQLSEQNSGACGGVIGYAGRVKELSVKLCSGGTEDISGTDKVSVGRIVGQLNCDNGNYSSGTTPWYKNSYKMILDIDDNNGDSYDGIATVGLLGDPDEMPALIGYMIVNGGTLKGDIKGKKSFFYSSRMEFKAGAGWNDTVYDSDTAYEYNSSNQWEIKA